MSSCSAKSFDLISDPDGENARPPAEPRSLPFSITRILLLTSLIGVSLAFGGEVTWARVSLGLVACLGLFFWSLGCVRQGVLKLIWSPLYLLLGMFFLVGLAQYVARLTLETSETREALVLLAAVSVFFFLAVQLFSSADSKTWRTFGLTVAAFAGSLGLATILQSASGVSRIYGMPSTFHNIFGPYDNPDHYAGLMEMLIPIGAFYIAERQRRLSRGAVALLGLAVVAAVASHLLTGSRGGLVALSAEGVFIGLLLRRRARIRTIGSLIAVTATILAAILLFSWVDSGWGMKRLGAVSEWADASRKIWALNSLRMWRDHPILGVGLGNFAVAYPAYQTVPSELLLEHAHNDYVEAVAESGLVGAILIVSALAVFLHLAFRDLRHRLSCEGGWIRLGAAIGCCGLLVHSFFDYNLHIPANAAWFAVLAAIAMPTEKPTPAKRAVVSETIQTQRKHYVMERSSG
jgi:hypothetical protein